MADDETDRKRHESSFNSPPPFIPPAARGGIDPAVKMANTAEYIAHQLFHIRKALEKIADTSRLLNTPLPPS
jgi:hypothetical protein